MACVLSDSIEVVGICQDFPNNCQGAFTQLKVPEIVEIPEQKPDIEQIIQVLVEGKITSLKIIKTPPTDEEAGSVTSLEGQTLTGEKLVIEGKIHQKIVYVADVESGSQPVHSAEFDIPFSTFVVVPECYEGTVKPGKEDQINVQVCIEDVFIEEINPREVIKSNMLFINAIFPEEEVPPTIDDFTVTGDADNNNIIIRLTVSDNDDCLLDRIEIVTTDSEDNVVDTYPQSLRGETSAEVTRTITGLSDEEYTVVATVYDCAGNQTVSDPETVDLA